MKKSLLVSVIVLALVLSSAGLCLVFADSPTDYFASIPCVYTSGTLSTVPYSTFETVGLDVGVGYLLYVSKDESIVDSVHGYSCCYQNGSSTVGRAFCNISSGSLFLRYALKSNQSITTLNYYAASFSDSSQPNPPVYSAQVGSPSDLTPFATADDALQGYVDFRSNNFSVDVTERFLYSMPSGYLLKLSSTASFSVDRRFYSVMNSTYNYLHLKNNSAGSDGVTDFRENGAFHGVVSSSSLVNGATLGTIFTGTGNEVPWQPTNANIFGRATDYSYLGTQSWTVPVGSSFVIWYPYYYGLSDPDINEPNISLNLLISHSQPLTVDVIKIQADSTVYDNSVIVTSSLTGDSTTGSQTESGEDQITITTTNTPTGGGNAGDAPLSDNTSVLGVLSRLTNLITGLFHDAIDAIQSLVNTGSSFMQVIAGMFSWLPPELLGILTSALVVIIVVGVVKLLL